MPKVRQLLMMTVLLVSLGLTAAACGSNNTVDTSPTSVATDTPVDRDTDELPVVRDDLVVDTPVVAGMCAPGEPDCEDTLVVDPPVSDLPSLTDEDAVMVTSGDAVTSGMVIDGGLTISEALATDAIGTLAVKGHLFDDGTGPQLCEGLIGLGERYGCDGGHISITNFDSAVAGDDIVIHDGLTYTEELITLFGKLVDGSLVVDDLVDNLAAG